MKTATKLRIMTTAAILGGMALRAETPALPAPTPQPPAVQQPPAPQDPGPQGMPRGDAHQTGMSRPTRGPGGPNMERQAPRPAPLPDRNQLKQAGATDAQIQELNDLDYARQEKRIDLQSRVEKAELTLGHLMQATNLDEKAVMDAAAALSSARGEMLKLDVASQLKVRQVLGAELLRKLREMAPPPQMSQPPRAREQGEAGHDRQSPQSPDDDRRPNNGPSGMRANNDGPRPPIEEGGR